MSRSTRSISKALLPLLVLVGCAGEVALTPEELATSEQASGSADPTDPPRTDPVDDACKWLPQKPNLVPVSVVLEPDAQTPEAITHMVVTVRNASRCQSSAASDAVVLLAFAKNNEDCHPFNSNGVGYGAVIQHPIPALEPREFLTFSHTIDGWGIFNLVACEGQWKLSVDGGNDVPGGGDVHESNEHDNVGFSFNI
jgi:hypothetical protein